MAKFKWHRSKLLDKVRSNVEKAVIQSIEGVREEAISLILDTQKTGRIYRRRSIEHQASAPGEAPASDTGRLVNSIRVEYDLPNLTGRIVVGAAYGMFLEYGTQTIEPRPFLRPALARSKGVIEGNINDAVRRAFK